MSASRETIMIIKDSLFESVIMGDMDLRKAANWAHHMCGYKKEDIMQAIAEMQKEAGIGED